MVNFIPELKGHATNAVPFFEDGSLANIPGRGTEKSIDRLQKEILELMTKLGAFAAYFVPGQYPGKPTRYGFQIHFQYANARGRIDCAALPIRKETPHKKDRAQAQALFLLRDKLEVMVFAAMYEPGSVPLVPYLIGAGGKTVTEALIESGGLPQLASGDQRRAG
jgi:hypothetical protein